MRLENNLQALFRKLESMSKSQIIDPESHAVKSFSEFKTKLREFESTWKKLRVARAELDSQRSNLHELVYKKLMDLGLSQVMAEEMKKQQAK